MVDNSAISSRGKIFMYTVQLFDFKWFLILSDPELLCLERHRTDLSSAFPILSGPPRVMSVQIRIGKIREEEESGRG